MPTFTVAVPMASLAIFDDIEADSSEAAILLVKERIAVEGSLYEACDRVEEHTEFDLAIKDDSEFPKEITAEANDLLDD